MSNKVLTFLPNTVECRCKDYISKVLLSSPSKLTERTYPNFQDKVLEIICHKLTTKDEEYKWSKEEYLEFRTKFTIIDNDRLPYLLDTILFCLQLSKTETLEELSKLTEIIDWYPEFEFNKNTGIMPERRPIEYMDIYDVISNTYSQIRKFIRNYSRQLINRTDNSYNIYSKIKNLKQKNNFDNEYHQDLENKFYKLRENKVTCGIYEKMYLDFLEMIGKDMSLIERKSARQEVKIKKYNL